MLSIKRKAVLIITVIAVIAAAIISVKVIGFVNDQNTKKMITADISDIFSGVTVLDSGVHAIERTYSKYVSIYIQADTSEKAKLVLEKIPDLDRYISNNSQYFGHINNIAIHCIFEKKIKNYPTDGYTYYFSVHSPNEVTLYIDFDDFDGHDNPADVFKNNEFPNIKEIGIWGEYDEEAVEEISLNFPDLKNYKFYNNRGEIVKEESF